MRDDDFYDCRLFLNHQCVYVCVCVCVSVYICYNVWACFNLNLCMHICAAAYVSVFMFECEEVEFKIYGSQAYLLVRASWLVLL